MLHYYPIMSETIDWENVIKKEARGINDFDLGEVQEVKGNQVITKKGIVDKDRFYIPKSKAKRFDGDKLWFEVTKEDAELYKHSETIDWENVIKKEARGLDDYDLGEVQEVNQDVLITKKGVVDIDRFYIPRSKALRFEEDKLWLEVSKDEAKATSRTIQVFFIQFRYCKLDIKSNSIFLIHYLRDLVQKYLQFSLS